MTEANEIPLAAREEGPLIWDVGRPARPDPAFWFRKILGEVENPTTDPGTPHALAVGEGADVRRLRRRVIEHALEHADSWRIVALDTEGGEFGYLDGATNATVATDLPETVAALREVEAEIERRHVAMRDAGAGNLHELNPEARRVLVVAALGNGEPEGRETAVLEELRRPALLGAAAGVHLFLTVATLRGLPGQLFSRLRPRVVLSGVEEVETRLALEIPRAAKGPRLRERQVAVQSRHVAGSRAKETFCAVGYLA